MISKMKPLSVLLAAGALAAATAGGAEAAAGWQAEAVPVTAGNLLALAAVAPHVTWAAGFQQTMTGGKSEVLNPVVLSRDDRDGLGWQRVATPGDALFTRANAISADGADDVWVVGDSDTGHTGASGTPIFAEHWDGSAWTIAQAPVPADVATANLLGVAAVGPDDAWAVGEAQVLRGQDEVSEGLIEHWDGHSWQEVKLPVGAASLYLSSVTATGPDDVWAVGSVNAQPVALHFDGTSWSQVPGLPTEKGGGEFNTVLADSPQDVWAAGDAGSASGPLIEHFDGHRWTAVAAPGAGEIFAAAGTPTGVAFIGYTRASGVPYGEEFDGGQWTDLGLPALGVFDAPYAVAADDGEMTVSGVYDTGDGGMHPLMLSRPLS